MYRIQAKLGVQAPAAAVWAAMEDLDLWAEWNPLYVGAEGRFSIGCPIELTRVMGNKRELLPATVVDWVPGAQLVWKRTISPFARSLGYIEIEALTETASILAAGEIYEGLIGQRIGHAQRHGLRKGFVDLCEALKARAEATWDGTPDASVAPPPPVPVLKPTAVPKPMPISLFGRK